MGQCVLILHTAVLHVRLFKITIWIQQSSSYSLILWVLLYINIFNPFQETVSGLAKNRTFFLETYYESRRKGINSLYKDLFAGLFSDFSRHRTEIINLFIHVYRILYCTVYRTFLYLNWGLKRRFKWMKVWYFYGWKFGTKDSISGPEIQHVETRVRV